jgi:hypothetical protein
MNEGLLMNLDELQEEAQKLLKLLEDRQIGTMGWNMFMTERLQKIKQLIENAGI